jgi:peptidoglycan/xylan/chitin deacetylase (PgdA/CDA1 family)
LNGAFVISLDFELYWGVRDSQSIEHYKENILGVWDMMPRLLDLFSEFNVKATFAAVGLLTFENKEALIAAIPEKLPHYEHAAYNWYPHYLTQFGHSEEHNKLHFAPSLITKIHDAGVHEICSHTFSHYYTLEAGADIESFKADLDAAKKRAHALGIPLNTIIFPRNQYNNEYLKVCQEKGFMGFRGTEDSWIYKPLSRLKENAWRRFLRLIDSYWNISGTHSYEWNELKDASGLYNIPASRFLRPYSNKLRFLEGFRLKRITNAMTHAAMNGEVFHLWWHPHNFGRDIQKNLNFLRAILEHQHTLYKIYGFESRTMNKCYSIINNYEQR